MCLSILRTKYYSRSKIKNWQIVKINRPLKLVTEEDYDAFCLSYMFTYRDFEKGTLGLAWTGDLKNAGGVCEKNGVSSVPNVTKLIRPCHV